MMKLSKKAMSTLLAAAMTCSMAVPAFAAGNDTVTVAPDTTVPTISVSVATATGVQINPYQMAVTVDGKQVTDSIITGAAGYIKSTTKAKLSIKAEVTGTEDAGGAAKFSAKALTGKETDKLVFMYAEFASEGVSWDASANSGAGGLKFDKSFAWGDYNAKNKNQVLVGTTANSSEVGTIAASDGTKPTVMAFRLAGEANGKATTEWTEDDKVSVSLALTFTPTV